MKVLIVCSGNSGRISPFVKEQAESIEKLGIVIDYFLIKGKGISGYLKNYGPLIHKIKGYSPELIHAHYGFSGLLSALQRKIPVITTFHGSDINNNKNLIFSYFASKLSRENIFVHPSQPKKINARKPVHVIPCGVDFSVFYPMDKQKSRYIMRLEQKKYYALFSSRFDNKVKNYPLAKKALSIIDENVKLVELKNFYRPEVNMLMNAVDFLLVTSFSETGPLVIKEAMACNCPIVSVDVGDVKEVIGKTEGCFIASYEPTDFAKKIEFALNFNNRTNGRQRIEKLGIDLNSIATKILTIYRTVGATFSYFTKENN